MIEATFDIALRTTPKVLSVSNSVEELLGYTQLDFLTSKISLSDRIHSHDADIAASLFSSESQERTGKFNIRLRHADGRIRCVRGSYRKRARSGGEVTLRLKLQDAKSLWKNPGRQRMPANLRAMLENTDDFIFFKDRNHVFTVASQNMTDGLDPAVQGTSLLGLTDYDLFPEEAADIYYRLEKQVFAGLPVASEVHENQSIEGRMVWLDNHNYPINDHNGKIIGLFGVSRDVTKQMKTQRALRESEESLKEAQRIAGLGSYVLDVSTGSWTSSEVMDREFGIEKNYERTVAGWTNLIHPEDRATMAAYLEEEVIRKGQPFNREYRIVRQDDGMERWISGLGTLEFDAAGQPVAMRGTIQDVTERKVAELAFRESKELFQLLIEHAPVSLAMFDREMRYLAVSRRGREQFDLGDREIIGLSHYETLPWLPERFKEMHRRALAGETIRSENDRFEKSDGTVIWGRSEVLPWRSGDGSIGGIILITEDITERKLAEIELRESKELLQLFIQNAPAALAMFDREMRYLAVSNRWLHDYVPAYQEIIGHSHYESLPETPDRWREDHRRALQGEIIRSGEECLRRKDGSVLWLLREVRPWRTGDGSIGGIIIFWEDVTRQKKAAERLNLAASVFSQASEGIVITDSAGTILEVNDAFTRISGYTREEVLGRNPRILKSGRQSKEFYADMWRDLIQKGRWSGEIWNRAKDGGVYAETITISALRDASGNTEKYVAVFSDITPIKEHEKQLEHVANYDVLTGLPNRTQFGHILNRYLAHARLRRRQIAVVHFNIDDFKAITDQYGRDTGDKLLIAFSHRIKHSLHGSDTLARIAGDDFVAILPDIPETEGSLHVLTQILRASSEPVRLGELVVQVSASAGVTFYPQTEEVDANQLLRQASQALFEAKQEGKKRYHIFDADLNYSSRNRHQVLENIRKALEANQFVLYYQPKVNMCTGAVVGAEALIRWSHPERGLLPPSEFLPAIEGHSLAVDVGNWVINSALVQIELWRAMGLEIPVSVNIGAEQLQQADFVDSLSALLKAHPTIPPSSLEIEVLESSAIQDEALASAAIHGCKRLGVSFALDDFGTGYASLAYLKRLPVDVLKIDRTFVREMLDEPGNLAIVEGILGLATGFRCQTVAEGVETLEQGLMLLRFGCPVAQGYAIARPMPALDLPAWVSAWRPNPEWAGVVRYDANNRPVLYAIVEHRAWIVAIEDLLKGKRQNAPALELKQCRFEIWLRGEALVYGQVLQGRGGFLGFRSIDLLHQRIHALAGEILSLNENGQNPEAMGRLSELQALESDLFEKLNNLVHA